MMTAKIFLFTIAETAMLATETAYATASAGHSSGAANPSAEAGFSWVTAGSRLQAALHEHRGPLIAKTRQRRDVDTSGLTACTNNRGCPNRDDGSIWFCANCAWILFVSSAV